MKLKIFSNRLLLACGLLLAAQGGFAQSNKTQEDKEYKQQMQKLQEQMRDLQKQMQKLQTKEFTKKTADLQKMARELSAEALAHVNDYDVSGAVKGLGITSNLRSYGNLGQLAETKGYELFKSPNTFNYNFNYTDDGKLKDRIASGEVKEKLKSYTKSYSVNGNDKLQINNSFGKVTVNTWTKNEVKVEVQIKAYADDEDEAQKLIDNITITDSKENAVISFKTNIDANTNKNSNNNVIGTWFTSGKSHTRKMEVNYTIYMPAKSQLDITNKFGGIVLPDLSGKLNVNLTYGNLVGQQLTNPENSITVKFGEARIASYTSGDLNVSYGKLLLGMADNLKAKVSFSSINVDRLKSSGDIDARYGDGITVGEFDKNFKNLSVDARFTKVNLNLKDNFDFDVSTTYGSFNYDNNAVKVITRTPADDERRYISTRNFKGQVNKGNAAKMITIRSSYASVKFD